MSRSTHRGVSPDIKIEMITAWDSFMPTIDAIVERHGVPAGEAEEWSKSLRSHLASGEAMVVSARYGRTLAGFLVLEPSADSAPFSWVTRHYKNCGLGHRFYSFACINLAPPAPEFMFHKDFLDEYAGVLKQLEIEPEFRDPYYVLHARQDNSDDSQAAA
ncbi:MAG: hypothetical protein EXQ84_06315 [Rhodospirillaceae bacterium]|nr:hypothetical protein [Rhodospirillaceae bacterium]